MPIHFSCPVCKANYTVDDSSAGKKAACKSCGQRLQVPAPQRANTVLGEYHPPTEAKPKEPSLSKSAGRQTTSPTSGPIKFNCPHCSMNYTVNRLSAGKAMECRICSGAMTVPGSGRISEPPTPIPIVTPVPAEVQQHEEPEEPRSQAEPTQAEPSDYPRSRPQTRGRNEPVNRILAAVGACLLFVGLFLPMIHAPLGVWMSFIDMPWKAVTAGFAIADKISDEAQEAAKHPREERSPNLEKVVKKEAHLPSGKPVLAIFVALCSVLYPLLILVLVGLTAFNIANGRRVRNYSVLGIVGMVATGAYAVAVLSLNAIEEMRRVMAVISPGFGWAVLLIGGLLLTISGRLQRAQYEDS